MEEGDQIQGEEEVCSRYHRLLRQGEESGDASVTSTAPSTG